MPDTSERRTILAIETSCDETAAAVIRDGRRIVSNVVASQMHLHERYGGVVPELASREHITNLVPVLREALAALPSGWDEVDAVACTYGPGLAGALLAGVSAAKALAWARGKPLIAVNHLEAHIYANWLDATEPRTKNQEPRNQANQQTSRPEKLSNQGSEEPESPRSAVGSENLKHETWNLKPGAENSELGTRNSKLDPQFPVVCLIVSGGHTALVLLRGHGDYQLLGQTRDDAAGEAFDKAARLMGLGYPGGPRIEKVAAGVDSDGIAVPRAWLGESYDFSFSGVKTHVLHAVARAKAGRDINLADAEPMYVARLAAAFQESVVDVLAAKTARAAERYGAATVLLAGGVAANAALRAALTDRSPVAVRYPPLSLCTDNAAMVGAAAYFRYDSGLQNDWTLGARPNLRLVG